MIKIKQIYFALFLLLFPLITFSQNDKRLSEDRVPRIIKEYIQKEYPGFKKVKYYTEIINDTLMYVAELEKGEEEFSLQFYENGKLNEIEKEVEFETLPESTRKNIDNELKNRFRKYKIQKVQFVNPHLVTEYELSIKAKTVKGTHYFEFYFDKDGKFLKEEETVLKPIPSQF